MSQCRCDGTGANNIEFSFNFRAWCANNIYVSSWPSPMGWRRHCQPTFDPKTDTKIPKQNNINYVILFWTQFLIWTHIYSQNGVKMGPKLLLRGGLFHESRETRDFFNQRGGPLWPSWSLLHWKTSLNGPNMAPTRRIYKQKYNEFRIAFDFGTTFC